MKISKSRFDAFIKMRDSGRMNMWGYPDKDIIPNFNGLSKHFLEDKREDDYEVTK